MIAKSKPGRPSREDHFQGRWPVFARNLKRLRERRRLDPVEFAQALSARLGWRIATATVYQWEGQKAVPHIRFWDEIAAVLGCQPHELVKGKA